MTSKNGAVFDMIRTLKDMQTIVTTEFQAVLGSTADVQMTVRGLIKGRMEDLVGSLLGLEKRYGRWAITSSSRNDQLHNVIKDAAVDAARDFAKTYALDFSKLTVKELKSLTAEAHRVYLDALKWQMQAMAKERAEADAETFITEALDAFKANVRAMPEAQDLLAGKPAVLPPPEPERHCKYCGDPLLRVEGDSCIACDYRD